MRDQKRQRAGNDFTLEKKRPCTEARSLFEIRTGKVELVIKFTSGVELSYVRITWYLSLHNWQI